MTESHSGLEKDLSGGIHIEDGQRMEIDEEKERALLRKIDYRLIPCVWFMYLLSYVSISTVLDELV